MNWHVITGSKGGVGKTLLTLLLLAHQLKKEPSEGVLFLDLNGMNTDSSAMLLHGKEKIGEPHQLGNEHPIIIQKTYSVPTDKENKDRDYYAVGVLEDPFALYDRHSFPQLITTIKDNAEEIASKLNLPPLQHVIIDTNYHFCNLFGNDDVHYQPYLDGGTLYGENLSIWFFWVYRQWEKLRQGGGKEVERVKLTASAMERNLNNSYEGVDSPKITPLMHVFSPVALVTSVPQKKNLLGRITEQVAKAISDENEKEYLIQEFQTLGDQTSKHGVTFRQLLERLRNAYDLLVDKDSNVRINPAAYFLDIIVDATRGLSDNQKRPRNIIPLSVYDPDFKYYTDRDRQETVSALRGRLIYRCFEKLLP
ncbi:MAG: hypothetical protein BWK78_00115 [Thiotrichaceae bacterium IS1]|nr:MAG: hypothetical protein BWK78_00115 [Thiotrichaceae bacterium IS1]